MIKSFSSSSQHLSVCVKITYVTYSLHTENLEFTATMSQYVVHTQAQWNCPFEFLRCFYCMYTNMNLLSLLSPCLPLSSPPLPSPSCNKGYIDHVSKRDSVFPHGLASDVFFLAGRTSAFVIHSAYFNKLETLETRIAAMFWFGFETLTVPTIIFQNTAELFDSRAE